MLPCYQHLFNRILILSFGTDGIDGNSEAAGAIADGTTIHRGKRLGLNATDYLEDNDSNTFFSLIRDAIEIGPTGTNVGDLTFVILW